MYILIFIFWEFIKSSMFIVGCAIGISEAESGGVFSRLQNKSVIEMIPDVILHYHK